jgi:hypothetical protein
MLKFLHISSVIILLVNSKEIQHYALRQKSHYSSTSGKLMKFLHISTVIMWLVKSKEVQQEVLWAVG